jgi:hypothetical protein
MIKKSVSYAALLTCLFMLVSTASFAQEPSGGEYSISMGKIKKQNEDLVDLAITNTTKDAIFLLNYQCEYPMRFLASQPFISPGATAVYRIKVNPRKEGKFEERLQLYFSHSEDPFVFLLNGDVEEVPVNDLQKCPSFKDLPSKRELVRKQKRAQGNIKEYAINLGGETEFEQELLATETQVASEEDTITNEIPVPAILQEVESSGSSTSLLKADSLLGDDYLPNNIIFLIDASSSMEDEGRFELLKLSLIELLKPLRSIDYLSMISYAGEADLLMEPTSSIEKERIEERIQALKAGGSTNAVKGIDLALETAYESFIEGGNNEIYLVTDGEFYLGKYNQRSRSAISRAAAKGIHISALAVKSERKSRQSLKEIADLGEGKLVRLESISDKDIILKSVKENSLK